MNGRSRQYNNHNQQMQNHHQHHNHYNSNYNNQRQEQILIRNHNKSNASNVNNNSNSLNPSNQNQIIFMAQPSPIQQGQNGNMIPALIGQPLIPIDISSKITSYTQMNKDIIEEIKAQQNNPKQDINTLYKSYKEKCDLHTLKLSNKCRKCKLIQSQLELQQQQSLSSSIKPLQSTQIKEESISSFKINKNSISGNLNSLILNNILSCQYFKEVLVSKSFQEVIDEIIVNVSNIEAWAVGINGVPSTFFCCFYRLVLLSLNEKQVISLTKHKNTYVRIAGLLYIRYLSYPSDLWKLLSVYIDDKTLFHPTVDQKIKLSIGDYVIALFKDYNHYGTRLPRIPTQIERDIKMNLLMKEEYEQRKKKNEAIIGKVEKGMKCKVLNKEQNGEELIGDFVSYDGNNNDEQVVIVMINGKEKTVSIGDIEVIDSNEYNKRNERKNESNKHHMKNYDNNSDYDDYHHHRKKNRINHDSHNDIRKRHDDDDYENERNIDKYKHRHHNKTRSRSGCRNRSRSHSRSRSRPHSKKPYINHQDKALKRIIENERNAAIARGKDYAIKPTSFKKSISVKVPGIAKKASRSPSPIKPNIQILQHNPKPQSQIIKEDNQPQSQSSSYSKEYLQRQADLKKQYTSTYSSKYPNKKGSDYIGPEIMKLG